MNRHVIALCLVLAAGVVRAEDLTKVTAPAPAPEKEVRFFEMRTYYAVPGKFDALQSRFLHFNNKLMVKHGMEIVGSWIPFNKSGDAPDKLIYILSYPSHDARDKDWKEFSDDIEWLAVKTDSERDGKLIARVDSVYMTGNPLAPPATVVSPP